MSDRKHGVVKWFDPKKGFGFITGEDGQDSFVHFSDIKEEGYKNLNEGDKVSFGLEQTERGEKAVEVTKV